MAEASRPDRTLIVDLGLEDYGRCLEIQRRTHEARIEGWVPDCLFLVEHPHVFTVGKRGNKDNILVPAPLLERRGIACVDIERGGDVTYHGPGQLVGYPIFALRRSGIGVVEFVERLEEVMIRVLADYGIAGERSEANRGVWVGRDKLGFVGIAVRRGVAFHGIALNVDADLSFFEMIRPCGLTGVKVTSMRSLLGRELSLEEVKARAAGHFEGVFGRSLEPWSAEAFLSRLQALGAARKSGS